MDEIDLLNFLRGDAFLYLKVVVSEPRGYLHNVPRIIIPYFAHSNDSSGSCYLWTWHAIIIPADVTLTIEELTANSGPACLTAWVYYIVKAGVDYSWNVYTAHNSCRDVAR